MGLKLIFLLCLRVMVEELPVSLFLTFTDLSALTVPSNPTVSKDCFLTDVGDVRGDFDFLCDSAWLGDASGDVDADDADADEVEVGD